MSDKKLITDILDILPKYLEDISISDPSKIIEASEALDRNLLIEEIDEETGVIVENFIRFWNKEDEYAEHLNGQSINRKPIKIYIDSPGGYLHSTLTAIDAIQLSKTPVYTINIGQAYSGGFFIFIAGHKRIAYPNSAFLFHEGSISAGGDANKFQNQADFYKKQRGLLKKITIEKTNINEELYEKHEKDDWWLFAEEAKELGIVDEIADKFI